MASMKLTDDEVTEMLTMLARRPYIWGIDGRINKNAFSRYFGVPTSEIKRVEKMLDNKLEDIV